MNPLRPGARGCKALTYFIFNVYFYLAPNILACGGGRNTDIALLHLLVLPLLLPKISSC